MNTRTMQEVDGEIKHHCKNPIKIDKLVEKVLEEYDVGRQEAKDRVMALIQQGTLFEPEPGKVKMLKS